MKHKWVTLMTMQSEIYHQNSQYFYPSEPFKKIHITMRHPVIHRNSKLKYILFVFNFIVFYKNHKHLLCFIKHITYSCIKSFAACMGGGNGGIDCPYRFFIYRKDNRNRLYLVLPPNIFEPSAASAALFLFRLGLSTEQFFEDKLFSSNQVVFQIIAWIGAATIG